jgi:hypothetical protein
MLGVLEVGKKDEQKAQEYANCETPVRHKYNVLSFVYLTRVWKNNIDSA